MQKSITYVLLNSVMRNCTVYYKPIQHDGTDNNTDATYRYVLNPETVGTFSNITNGERVAGLTGRDLDGNWKRFRFEGIVRLAGL